MRETNPIRGVNRAKQSQFAPCGWVRERSRWPIVQNKAKLGQDGTSGAAASARPIAPNKPNSQQCRVGRGHRSVGRGANAQNEPNCPKRGTEAVSRLRISDCGLRIGDRSAAGRPCGLLPRLWQARCTNKPNWLGPIMQNEPNFSGRPGSRRTRCAERTQFPAGQDTPHHSNTPLFHHFSIPIFVVHPSQQWGCWRIDGASLSSILSGDSVR